MKNFIVIVPKEDFNIGATPKYLTETEITENRFAFPEMILELEVGSSQDFGYMMVTRIWDDEL